jgi:hypothetical protein
MNFELMVDEVLEKMVKQLIDTRLAAAIDETKDADEHFLKGCKAITTAANDLKKLLNTFFR